MYMYDHVTDVLINESLQQPNAVLVTTNNLKPICPHCTMNTGCVCALAGLTSIVSKWDLS